MNVLDNREVKDFIRMCGDAYAQGWHESNGGNASHRLTAEAVKQINSCFDRNDYYQLGVSVPKLANQYFLITGSGKCFRNIEVYPSETIAVIEIDSTGTGYYIRWGLTAGGKPTMETATHLSTHNIKCEEEMRTLLHSHPVNINALTFLLEQDSKLYTKLLWGMITECSIVFPKGVGIIDWMPCGDDAIANATLVEMEKCDFVIWPHHGVFAISTNFDTAFGLLQTVEKAAEILLKVMSAGELNQYIGYDQVKQLSEIFDFEFDHSIYI